MDIEKTIREYIAGPLHMSLATSVDNKPWVCEVHFVYDDDLNLYWRSLPGRRHSQEIAQNPNVAGNIVEQHGLTQKPRGIYFEGEARMLDDTEAEEICPLFQQRMNMGLEILQEAKADGPKFYKVTVREWYMFDARESNPGQKYQLKR